MWDWDTHTHKSRQHRNPTELTGLQNFIDVKLLDNNFPLMARVTCGAIIVSNLYREKKAAAIVVIYREIIILIRWGGKGKFVQNSFGLMS